MKSPSAFGVAVILGFGALTSAGYPPQAEEIYKSVDAQGHVVYSDRGASSTSQKSVVRVDQPNAVEAARSMKEQEILKSEDAQRKKQQSADDRQKALLDHDKQVRCQNARERYSVYKEVGRIFHADSQGNRVYYSDAEADALRAQARQAMAAACGP